METSKDHEPVFLDRASRMTRGKRMTKLLDEENEEDELFWNQDALKDEENDNIYEQEAEVADEFDSDFNEDEPEPDDDAVKEVDVRMPKKRLIYPGKPSTKKKKKKSVALSKLESPTKGGATSQQLALPKDNVGTEGLEEEKVVRKSTRTSVVVRQAERDAIRAAIQVTMKPIKRRKEGEEKRMTQEEMLLEAAQTDMPRLPRLSTTPTTRREDPSTPNDDGRELVAPSSQRTEGSEINSRISRGVARGTRVESGDGSRLEVPILTEWNAPIGPNATKFAGELGCRVRQDLSSFDYDRWSSIPALEKAPIVTSVKSKFTCLGDPKVVDSVINRKLATSARQNKYRWHTKWKKLVQERGEAYARENPPAHCTVVQWTKMIDNAWTTQTFKDKSSKNKVNRSKQTINHSCGSTSLAARAHDSMEGNEGQLNFPNFFKDTRYNSKTGKWSTPACETIRNNMINDVESQSSQADSVFLTLEEMSTRYLCTKSGVLKGIGGRPSLLVRSTASSGSERKLQEEIVAQQRLIEEQNRRIEEQQTRMEEQQLRMNTMIAWMTTMGYPGGPRPPPPDSSAGCGLAA